MTITTTTVEANGLTFTADTGDASADGELVVFLHGFPHSRYSWRAEVAALDEAGYRVVAFDQRGYSAGARPGAIDDYRVEHLVSDVLAVADAVAGSTSGAGDPGFHLVGHDWGGQLGWITAAQHPDRVKTLSVISRPHPAAFMDALANDPDQAERSKHHGRHQKAEATDEYLVDDAVLLRRVLGAWGASAADVAAYLDVLGTHEALDAAINWYRAMGASTPLASDVPPVTVPTLYVWGNEDASVGRMAAEATEDFVEGPYRFVEVPGGSHCITDQSPGVFPPLLLEHLSHSSA